MPQPTPTAPRSADFGDFHRTKLSPDKEARAIHLLFVDQLSVDIVATRMGLGVSTIRRIRVAHCEKIDARKLINGRR